MSCARRLASVLLVMALGTSALAGCQSNPTAAVYVGGKQYTNQYVEKLNDQIVDVIKGQAPQAQQQKIPYAELRQLIVSSLVIKDVGARLAARYDVNLPAANPELTATQIFGVSPASPVGQQITRTEMAKVLAEAVVVVNALSKVAPAVNPSEADQREIYDALVSGGQVQGATFEQIRPYLTKSALGNAIGLRDLLTSGIEKSDVKVNPRYSPLSHRVPVTIEDVQTFISAPISTR